MKIEKTIPADVAVPRHLLAVLLSLMALAFSISTEAAPITWTNLNGGVWTATTNWSPNTVPVAADDVFITNSGTYTVTMNVSPTIASLTLGGASGLQTLTNTSQTLSVSQASSVGTNGILGMNNGVLTGAGSLNIKGLVRWNGGSSGSGFIMTVQSNAVLSIDSTVTLAGVFTNFGTVNWLAGNLSLTTNAPATGTFWNQTNALFDIQCDQVVVNGFLVATFHNAGLVRKRITAGITTFNTFLDNSGTVQTQTGTINLAGGATPGGTFQANSGAAINFTTGTFTLSSPPDFQGPGPVQMTGGSLTLNAFTGTFTLNGIGLVGQNTVAATGIINLNGSSLGSGATLTILSNAVLNIQSTPTFSGVVTNLGTVNWLAGNINLTTNAPATGTFWNQTNALFDIQCDQVVVNGFLVATFHNAGLVRKRITAGITTFNTFLDNAGTVQAQTGTINLAGGATPGGTYQANSGATINFTAGTFTLSSPPDFQGPGTVQMTGGSLTLNAFTGTFNLNGISLVGQNTIAATGTINLNGSGLGNGATLTILSNAVLNIQVSTPFSGVVTNLGTVNWLAGNVNLNTNAPATGTFWNQTNALFDIQCDQVVVNGVLVATFHNAGLVRKRITAGTTSFNTLMDNTGTVQAQTGTIVFANGATLTGTYQANSGAAINFSGGTFTLSSPPNFVGPGPVQITGGNLTLNAFTGTFTLNGITLVGQNTIAAAGIVNLNGSGLGNGASLTILSNAVLNIQVSTAFSGVVTNLGTVNWLAGNVNLNTNAPATGTFWNQTNALFDIQCDQVVVNGVLVATFHNAGLLRKRITAGTTTFNTFFDNSGTVQAQTGTITFAGGAALTGTFQANSGAAINFSGGTFTLSSPPNFVGPGPVQITGGNLTLNAFTGTFTLNGITLVGQNTIADTGIINLNGSALGNGASLTVLSNAVLNVQVSTAFSGVVTNLGTVNWLAGNLNLNTNPPATGTFWNQTNALFDIQCDQVVVNGVLVATFHNAGLVRKRITAGTTTFNTFFDNSGTVLAQTGTINFSGGSFLGGSFQANSGTAINFNTGTYVLSSPPNFQGPGPIQITATTLNAFTGTFTLSGSTLTGPNTIAATGTISLTNSSLGPGATLTIASNGVLNILNATTLSGFLNNQGTVNWLAGNVTVVTNGTGATGAIRNQGGAVFDIQCDQTLNFSPLLARFNNAGVLRKSAGTNIAAITVQLDNTGTIQAKTGVIGVQGPYTESPSATLAIYLSALPPGTGFGKIQFTAKPTFAGQFALNTVGGYRPAPGNSFFVIGYPSAAGDFTSYSGMDLGSGLRLAPRSSASGLSLVAVSYTNGPLPRLTVERSVNGFFVAWPTNFTSGQLQFATNLATAWVTVPVNGANNTVVSNSPQGFFRLFQ